MSAAVCVSEGIFGLVLGLLDLFVAPLGPTNPMFVALHLTLGFAYKVLVIPCRDTLERVLGEDPAA